MPRCTIINVAVDGWIGSHRLNRCPSDSVDIYADGNELEMRQQTATVIRLATKTNNAIKR